MSQRRAKKARRYARDLLAYTHEGPGTPWPEVALALCYTPREARRAKAVVARKTVKPKFTRDEQPVLDVVGP